MANRKVVIFLNDGQLLVVKEALFQYFKENELWEHKNSECLAAIIIDIYQCFPYRYIRGAPRPPNGTPRPPWKVKLILFNFIFYKAPDHNGSHLRLPFL